MTRTNFQTLIHHWESRRLKSPQAENPFSWHEKGSHILKCLQTPFWAQSRQEAKRLKSDTEHFSPFWAFLTFLPPAINASLQGQSLCCRMGVGGGGASACFWLACKKDNMKLEPEGSPRVWWEQVNQQPFHWLSRPQLATESLQCAR